MIKSSAFVYIPEPHCDCTEKMWKTMDKRDNDIAKQSEAFFFLANQPTWYDLL